MDRRDKRANPRIDYQGRTVVYLGDQQIVCKGSNLSKSGMLLVAPLDAPLGETLKLAFSLAPSQWVNIEARVVRQVQQSSAVAWGLEFVRVSRDLATVLGSFVAEQLGLGAPGPGASSSSAGRSEGRRSQPAIEAPADAAPAPRGLFARLKSRISEAWSGGNDEPPANTPQRGTGYAMGRAAAPSRESSRPRETVRESSRPAIRPRDVPATPEIEDVLPDALEDGAQDLRRLYQEAVEDIPRDPHERAGDMHHLARIRKR